MLKGKGREEKTGRICLILTAEGLTPGQARQKPETRWAMKANKYKICSKSAKNKCKSDGPFPYRASTIRPTTV